MLKKITFCLQKTYHNDRVKLVSGIQTIPDFNLKQLLTLVSAKKNKIHDLKKKNKKDSLMRTCLIMHCKNKTENKFM